MPRIRMGWLLIGVALGWWAPARTAGAARFDVVELDGDSHALLISGYLQPGDQAVFHKAAAALDGTTVLTTGPGGSVLAAVTIGSEIRARGWATLVPPGTDCASACSMVWLAGQRRLMGEGARIGFHAMALQAHGIAVETHESDVDLRRWLTQLGYSYDTAATIVKTPAVTVHWLDPIELRANGIGVEPYP